MQPFDVAVRRGQMPWAKVTFPQQIGQEYSGVVDRLGEGVTTLAVGDAVLGLDDAGRAGLRGDRAGRERGARSRRSWTSRRRRRWWRPGRRRPGRCASSGSPPVTCCWCTRAAGSVGTLAVQLARLAGATVIGTASPANHGYLRQLGAVPVAYGDGLVDERAGDRADRRPSRWTRPGAGRSRRRSRWASTRSGSAPSPTTRRPPSTAPGWSGRAGHPARLAEVVALAAQGSLTMPVRAYPLAEVAEAHAAVEAGHGRGKVVLIVEP